MGKNFKTIAQRQLKTSIKKRLPADMNNFKIERAKMYFIPLIYSFATTPVIN
jgi:hypothetical protein